MESSTVSDSASDTASIDLCASDSSSSFSLFDTDDSSDGCDLSDGEDSDSSFSFEGLRELYDSFSQSFDETRESNFSSTLEPDTPFYDGSSLSSNQALVLIFQFVLKHSLTNTVFTELLQLLLVLLPKSTNIPRSVYLFKKYFAELFPTTESKQHKYCAECKKLLQVPAAGRSTTCTCATNPGKFVTVPVGPQLKRLFEDPFTWKCLQKRFRQPSPQGVYADIYDGREYKKHQAFLEKPGHVSLSFNTDGVAIYRSSQVSIWPVWFAVNELPIKMRYSKRFMILAAVWYSRHKPVMNCYLRPVIDDINTLYSAGIKANTPEGEVTVRALCLVASMDLPARAIVTNTKQFNGHYGCLYCEHPGVSRPGGQRGLCWPKMNNIPRREADLLQCAELAVISGDAVKGIKGPSVLSLHHPFKITTGVVVDDLHGLYLGVTKTLLKLWFGKCNRTKDYYVGNNIEDCNARLLSIRVPDVVSRTPKTLKDYTHWKASEMRTWILYYSIPVLHGFLEEPFLSHYSLLVAALQLLSSPSFTENELDYAIECLQMFTEKFADLYGRENMSMNIHLLEHLGECVKNWGPLWAYSCFAYEGMNAHLKHLFHGTRDMSTQMAFCHVAFQCLPGVLNSRLFSDLPPHVMSFVDILFGQTMSIHKQVIEDGIAVLGGVSLTCLEDDLQLQLPPQYRHVQLQTFYRAFIGQETIFSEEYTRVKKRNSYTVVYKDQGQTSFGKIKRFVYAPTLGLFCVMQQLVPTSTPSLAFELSEAALDFSGKIYPVEITTTLKLVPVAAVQSKCIFISFDNHSFIALMSAFVLQD